MKQIGYQVKIPSDWHGRYGERAMSREYEKEIEEWITDLYQQTDLRFIWFKCGFLTYEFSTEEAAMAFKLRWA